MSSPSLPPPSYVSPYISSGLNTSIRVSIAFALFLAPWIICLLWGLFYNCYYAIHLEDIEAEQEQKRLKNLENRRLLALEALVNHEVTRYDLHPDLLLIDGKEAAPSRSNSETENRVKDIGKSICNDSKALNFNDIESQILEGSPELFSKTIDPQEEYQKEEEGALPILSDEACPDPCNNNNDLQLIDDAVSPLQIPVGGDNSKTMNSNGSLRMNRIAELRNSLSFTNSFVKDGLGSIPDFDSSCGICLAEYEEKDIVSWSKDPSCRHAFHQHCLVPWLMSHNTCPNCRWNYFTNKYSK